MPFEPVSSQDFEPQEPEQFSRDLASAVNRLLDEPETLRQMGRNARQRVEQHFSWSSIAQRTLEFYRDLTTA